MIFQFSVIFQFIRRVILTPCVIPHRVRLSYISVSISARLGSSFPWRGHFPPRLPSIIHTFLFSSDTESLPRETWVFAFPNRRPEPRAECGQSCLFIGSSTQTFPLGARLVLYLVFLSLCVRGEGGYPLWVTWVTDPSLLPRLRLRFLFVDSRLQLNACGRTCFFFFLIETVQFFRVSSRFAFEFSSLKERRVEVRPRSHGCIRRCTQVDLGIWFT